jgi:hypothetical protein
MSKESQVIKTARDAWLYLGIAKELEPPLPIDLEIDRLDEKRILSGNDEVKRAARRAVYQAAMGAFEGPARARRIQEGLKATPNYLGALQKRVDMILQAYEEIHSSLSGHHAIVFMKHLQQAVASFPKDKRKELMQLFEQRFLEFRSFQASLHEFREVLKVGSEFVVPKRGRPKEAAFHFVSRLAVEWVKITGSPPTRSYDAIRDQESGDFYKFCVAAAATVQELVLFKTLDSAVRRVCSEWSSPESKDPELLYGEK